MDRKLAADELATFLATLGHPLRIRIIEELRGKELDVTSIYEALKEKQSKVSQQLSILRSQKMIVERKATIWTRVLILFRFFFFFNSS